MGKVADVIGNGGIPRGTLRTRLPAALLTLAVALVAFAVFSGSARAATLTVDDLGDTHDAVAGNGSCADAAGKCTLRAAIEEANALGSDDEIGFAGGLRGTITLANGELSIQSNLTITGPGADALTVSGNNADLTAFQIGHYDPNPYDEYSGNISVNISNLTIADAKEGGILHENGTLILEGNVIRNNGRDESAFGGIASVEDADGLIIQNTTINDNTGGVGGIGVRDAPLTMRDSTVRNNRATNSQSALYGGGGIYLSGSSSDVATVENSVIAGNTARNGGGVYARSYPSLTITRSTIKSNKSLGSANRNEGGGGLQLWHTNTTVRDSTITGNQATYGGGINAVASRVTVANSTISENLPMGFDFGTGIYSHSELRDGESFGRSDLTVLNSTVTENNSFGSIANQGDSTAAIGNSIVASDDQVGDLLSLPDHKGPGAFTSLGHNLIGSADGSTGFTNGQNGDLVGTNSAPIRPKLGPLVDNGGPTDTHALLSGSPALDAGKNLATGAGGNPVTTDQRGRTRPSDQPSVSNATGGDASDIGAYEAQAQPATNLTVNTLSGEDDGACTENDCSLREAIGAANSSPDRSTIGFSVTGTIALTGSPPSISTPVEITGPGARRLTVDGNAAHRIFSVEGGDSTISDLKIVRGRAEGGAGGNVNKTGGSLTLNRVSISGGDASEGGGIANTGGSLTILRSTVSGNGAATGAGVYNTATLQVDTSTISGNGGAFGGGLYNGGSGAATLLGSTVTDNSAARDGGGLRVASGTVRAGHTIIANNTADASGPDISGTLTSDDYNLIGDTQDATIGGTTTHNLTGTDPKLGPLADNGGPTDTHTLLRASPAIDAGADATGGRLSTDQRGDGFPRPRGMYTDIGAFEAKPNESPAAQDDAHETTQDEPLTVPAPGVLANDSDPDGDALTVVKASDPQSGTLALNSDGSFTYTPKPGFVGTDSFTYKASDGLVESAAATVSIAVLDREPPETTIDSGPTGTITVRKASFGFSSGDGDLERFECSLDSLDPADFGVCTSPKNYPDLTDGQHTFRVRAVDASGNADATPAERPFAVDATVPSAPKIKSPANHSYDADGSFAIKGTAEAGSTVRLYEIVKLSDGTTKKVFKGAATARSSGSWGKTLSGVANGKHSYKATATDEAGNVSAASAARTITVDKIRPVVKSVSPVNKVTGVPPTTNVSAAFSEAMKASTLNRLTFTLVRKGTTTKVAATVSYNPNTKKVMLNPTKSLMRGATYTAKITPGAKDLAGNGLEGNRVWYFRVRP